MKRVLHAKARRRNGVVMSEPGRRRLMQTIFLDPEGRDNPKTATHAKVYKDLDWDEYIVEFYVRGVHNPKADYHTLGGSASDKADAISTAMAELNRIPNPAAHSDQGPATYSVHVDMGGSVHSPARESNPKDWREGDKEGMAKMRAHLDKVDREVLFASGAYGRHPTLADWEGGKDFKAYQPRWKGGPYFSIRDVDRIYAEGYRTIAFGGHEGFNVELVVQ